jgi:N-acetylmuramoyl-L-alanine amidase
MPAVILEPFFISNPGDLARVREVLPQLAQAIADGVSEWFIPK